VSEPDRVAGAVTLMDVLNCLNVKLNLEEPKASNLRYAGVPRETGARQQA
jgi:hypothetical protein